MSSLSLKNTQNSIFLRFEELPTETKFIILLPLIFKNFHELIYSV